VGGGRVSAVPGAGQVPRAWRAQVASAEGLLLVQGRRLTLALGLANTRWTSWRLSSEIRSLSRCRPLASIAARAGERGLVPNP
jgi:hypothetical protein